MTGSVTRDSAQLRQIASIGRMRGFLTPSLPLSHQVPDPPRRGLAFPSRARLARFRRRAATPPVGRQTPFRSAVRVRSAPESRSTVSWFGKTRSKYQTTPLYAWPAARHRAQGVSSPSEAQPCATRRSSSTTTPLPSAALASCSFPRGARWPRASFRPSSTFRTQTIPCRPCKRPGRDAPSGAAPEAGCRVSKNGAQAAPESCVPPGCTTRSGGRVEELSCDRRSVPCQAGRSNPATHCGIAR